MKSAMITGVTGQDGAYLSRFLLEKGYHIIGLIRNSKKTNLKSLDYLGLTSKLSLEKCDLLNSAEITALLKQYKPAEFYNLAAQSSVELSFQQPFETMQFNLMSVTNILACIRTFDQKIKFYQASTSEMYGEVISLPVTEDSSMHPLSPYGVSKASAHWLTVNYREAFGLFACCGILFNHESFLRRDNFFVKKVIKESLEIVRGERSHLRVGNLDVSRDFGYAPEYVKAMWLMLQASRADDYVVCSGGSISLRSIVLYVLKKLSLTPKVLVIDPRLYRPAEIKNICGDPSKAKKKLKWHYDLNFFDVLDQLIEEERRSH